MCYCFGEPLKPCQNSQIACSVLDSGPSDRRPCHKHLISLVSAVCTVNYGSSFFRSIYGNDQYESMEKASVRN